VLLVGPPGVGKSTLARALSERVGIDVIGSDVVRRTLFVNPSYSKSESGQVFDAIHADVEERLGGGRGVIVDATNLVEAERANFYLIAERLDIRLMVVRLRAAPDVVRKRLAQRTVDEGPGPAGIDVYERMRRVRQRIAKRHLIVDTTSGIEAAVEAVLREMEG
jgi:predicted kinase